MQKIRSKESSGRFDHLFDMYIKMWNKIVDIDRDGFYHIDRLRVHNQPLSGMTKYYVDTELLRIVIKDYKSRRALTKNPLRKKTPSRVSCICIDFGQNFKLFSSITGHTRRSTVGKLHLRRLHSGTYMEMLRREKKPRKTNDTKTCNIGIAIGQTISSIVVEDIKTWKRKFISISTKRILNREWVNSLYKLLRSDIRRVNLDYGSRISGGLSAEMRKRLTKIGRGQQAEGAIVFNLVKGNPLPSRCPLCDAGLMRQSNSSSICNNGHTLDESLIRAAYSLDIGNAELGAPKTVQTCVY